MYFQDSWEQWMWMQYIHGSDSGSRRSVFEIIIFLSVNCVSNFASTQKVVRLLARAQLHSGSRSSSEPTLKEQSAIDDHESSNQETLERPCSTSPPQLFYVLFCERQKSHQWGKEWLTGWLVDHVLVNLRNGFQRLWWRCLAPCPSLKFWFRQFNSHPFVLSLCAQLLHPLVFPACSSHLLKLKWIAFPAKQGIRFDLEGFTEERMEIWAN